MKIIIWGTASVFLTFIFTFTFLWAQGQDDLFEKCKGDYSCYYRELENRKEKQRLERIQREEEFREKLIEIEENKLQETQRQSELLQNIDERQEEQQILEEEKSQEIIKTPYEEESEEESEEETEEEVD